MPVVANYRVIANKSFALDVGAGPYLGLKLGDGKRQHIRKTDYGPCARIASTISGHYMIAVEGDIGLPDLHDNQYVTCRSTSLTVMVGYRF